MTEQLSKGIQEWSLDLNTYPWKLSMQFNNEETHVRDKRMLSEKVKKEIAFPISPPSKADFNDVFNYLATVITH